MLDSIVMISLMQGARLITFQARLPCDAGACCRLQSAILLQRVLLWSLTTTESLHCQCCKR